MQIDYGEILIGYKNMRGEEILTYNHDLMNKEQLLMELDSLGYSDRMKRMALLGRQHKGDADYSALLVSLLGSGTAYEAHLALTGACVVNDAHAVLFALKHPKAGVRGRAARLLPEVVTDPTFRLNPKLLGCRIIAVTNCCGAS